MSSESRKVIDQVEDVHREARNAAVQKFVDKFLNHPFFKQSKPPFDYELCNSLLNTFDYGALISELRKMNLWLLADPSRQKTNYRRFVVNWMLNADRPFIADRGSNVKKTSR